MNKLNVSYDLHFIRKVFSDYKFMTSFFQVFNEESFEKTYHKELQGGIRLKFEFKTYQEKEIKHRKINLS